MKQSMKKWALYYASLGLSVFPLIAREKRPSTENGCKAATTDVKTIKELPV